MGVNIIMFYDLIVESNKSSFAVSSSVLLDADPANFGAIAFGKIKSVIPKENNWISVPRRGKNRLCKKIKLSLVLTKKNSPL